MRKYVAREAMQKWPVGKCSMIKSVLVAEKIEGILFLLQIDAASLDISANYEYCCKIWILRK